MKLLLYTVQKIEIPYRAWCFVIVYIATALALFIKLIEPFFRWSLIRLVLVVGLIMLGAGYSAQQHYFINWTVEIDREAALLSQRLQELGAIETYSFSRYNKPLLEYYYLTQKKNLKVYMPFSESKDYKAFDAKIYQTVIWEKDTIVYIPTVKEAEILQKNH